jgi:hypothetical protein
VFTASATDNVGIWKVEFWKDADAGLFGVACTPPYSVSWTLTAGSHTAYAKAYDFGGNVTNSATVPFTVSDTTPPSVSITQPVNGSVARGVISVEASASDNVGVIRVEFYKDSDPAPFATVTTAPFSTPWNTASVVDGAHSLTATAYDAAGNSAVSASVSVAVDNTAPTVSLTAPADGATVSGTNVAISASASDGMAIQQVEFYRDGSVLLGVDSTSPYSITWNSTTVANGSHTLMAQALDTAGNAATSASRTITVSNGVIDTTPPTVSITSPVNGATVAKKTTVTIAATASDNVAVTKVEFSVDGSLKCTDTTAPYTCAWRVPAQAGRTYRLQAKAYDAASNVGSSSIVTVTSR